jgi:hypothetical protein
VNRGVGSRRVSRVAFVSNVLGWHIDLFIGVDE